MAFWCPRPCVYLFPKRQPTKHLTRLPAVLYRLACHIHRGLSAGKVSASGCAQPPQHAQNTYPPPLRGRRPAHAHPAHT